MSRRPERDLMRVAMEAHPTHVFLTRLARSGLVPEAEAARLEFEQLFADHWRAERTLDAVAAEVARCPAVPHAS